MARTLVWFSCGAASAVAAFYALRKYPDAEILYCDTLAYEHPDNRRFLIDVEKWLERGIKILRSSEYVDIFDVFDKTGWLVGAKGARCTTELKKNVRAEYQEPDDIHVFGFTREEEKRIKKFRAQNFDVRSDLVLYDQYVTRDMCYARLRSAGIELPAMYRLGYKNNNCIGCVKGGMGYWNKIRRDFPDTFDRMAAQERKMGATILSDRRNGKRVRLYLDQLDPSAGRLEDEPDIECGVVCQTGDA